MGKSCCPPLRRLECISSSAAERWPGSSLCRGCVYVPANADRGPDAEAYFASNCLFYLYFRANLWGDRCGILFTRNVATQRLSWWGAGDGGGVGAYMGKCQTGQCGSEWVGRCEGAGGHEGAGGRDKSGPYIGKIGQSCFDPGGGCVIALQIAWFAAVFLG